MAHSLDFAVIGAQKAGTTSVFVHLRVHPQIFMPADKELPFFSRDEVFERGLAPYLAEHFAGAPDDALWGTSTPQYMADPRVPARMRQVAPGIKLIALLRDPVERAFSHHQMRARLGWETRPFARAVDELSAKAALERARLLGDDVDAEGECYLTWGEYGRILGHYLREFPREQLLVLYAEDLARDPLDVLRRIFRFLEVDADFAPPDVARRHHAGGLDALVRRAPVIERIRPLWTLWRALPEPVRAPLRRWLETASRPKLDAATRARLAEFYADDVRRLEALTGEPCPWPGFASAGEARTGAGRALS